MAEKGGERRGEERRGEETMLCSRQPSFSRWFVRGLLVDVLLCNGFLLFH